MDLRNRLRFAVREKVNTVQCVLKEFVKEQIIEILKTDSESRTIFDERIVMNFLQNIRFFQQNKIKKRGILEMITGMYYESVTKGTSMCIFGQKGYTFHILLRGKCSVWLPLPNERISEVIQNFQEIVKLSQIDHRAYRELRFMCWDHDRQDLDFVKLFDPHHDALSQLDHKAKQRFVQDVKYSIRDKLATELISNLQKDPQYLSLDMLLLNPLFTPPPEVPELNATQNRIKKRETTQKWENLLERVTIDFQVRDHSDSDSAFDEDYLQSDWTLDLKALSEIKRQILTRLFQKLPNHRFKIDGQNYEYFQGQYFYEVSTLQRGSTFGELALLSADNLRCATVVCETNCEFATINRNHFTKCLEKLQKRHNLKLMNFLLEIPAFKGMRRNQMHKFIHLIKKEKFTYGQTVYHENDQVQFVYIVNKGDFELQRKLKKGEQISSSMQTLLDIKPLINILQSKLSEIVDTPSTQKLAIFGPGTILGEEDFIKRKHYSCSLKCGCFSGTLLKMTPELFEILMSNQPEQIQDQVTVKESWVRALQIQQPPMDLTQESSIEKLIEKVLPKGATQLDGRIIISQERLTRSNLNTRESITALSQRRPSQRTTSQLTERPNSIALKRDSRREQKQFQDYVPQPQKKEQNKPLSSAILRRSSFALSQNDNNFIVQGAISSHILNSRNRVSKSRPISRERFVVQDFINPQPNGKTFASGSETHDISLPQAFYRKSVQKLSSDYIQTQQHQVKQLQKVPTSSPLKFAPHTRGASQVTHLNKIVTEMRDSNLNSITDNNKVIMRSSLSRWTKASFRRIQLQRT